MTVKLLKHVSMTLNFILIKKFFAWSQNKNWLQFVFFCLVFEAGNCDGVIYLLIAKSESFILKMSFFCAELQPGTMFFCDLTVTIEISFGT